MSIWGRLLALNCLIAFGVGLEGAAVGAMAAIDPPEVSADDIYARLQSMLLSESYPSDIDYTVVVQVTEAGKQLSNHFDGEALPGVQDMRVEAFSKEEQAHPFTPHGINVDFAVSIAIRSGSAPVGKTSDPNSILHGVISKPPPPTDLLGIPELTPTYAFGIRPNRRTAQTDSVKDGPRFIGQVGTRTRYYSITKAGDETIDGISTLRLHFEPLKEPGRFRLRDLWIAATDYDLVQARVFGNFTVLPETQVPWLIRFARLNGATYISTETAEASLHRGDRTFDSAAVKFENIRAHQGPRDLRFAIPHDPDAPGRLVEP